MAVTATPVFPQAPKLWTAALLSTTGAFTFVANTATSAGKVTLVTAGANGTIIEALTVASTDTSARDLQLILLNTVDFVLSTFAIAANSGFTNALPPIDILRATQTPGFAFDVNGNRILFLPSGTSLCVGTLTAVTAAKQISVTAFGADF